MRLSGYIRYYYTGEFQIYTCRNEIISTYRNALTRWAVLICNDNVWMYNLRGIIESHHWKYHNATYIAAPPKFMCFTIKLEFWSARAREREREDRMCSHFENRTDNTPINNLECFQMKITLSAPYVFSSTDSWAKVGLNPTYRKMISITFLFRRIALVCDPRAFPTPR